MLIIGGSGSDKTNALLNLIKVNEQNLFICQRSIQIKVSLLTEEKM